MNINSKMDFNALGVKLNRAIMHALFHNFCNS